MDVLTHEYGVDYAFTPEVLPVDPEWRQSLALAQKEWLAGWVPLYGTLPQ